MSEHDQIICKNIEVYVDKLISSGSIPSEHRIKSINEYRKMNRLPLLDE